MSFHRKGPSLACSEIFDAEKPGECRVTRFERWLSRKCSGANLWTDGTNKLFNIATAAVAIEECFTDGMKKDCLGRVKRALEFMDKNGLTIVERQREGTPRKQMRCVQTCPLFG